MDDNKAKVKPHESMKNYGTPTYRRVTRTSKCIHICVSGQVPNDWDLVETTASDFTGSEVILKIRQIVTRPHNAQTTNSR